ncbi:protein kinase [Striga asiatica]|uniref:Protein kinase n=1 Tax=Striga asiatica TaxID=4170 RepID=A0A5A7Q7N5_STRAF|nr:protein kinase [Striga asiatica]
MLHIFLVFFILSLTGYINCATDPNDLKILNDFKNGLKNPELLKWPENGNDPCGPPKWDYVFCSNDRVTQIQVQGLGLEGTLPQNLNQLEMLENLGLQKNKFYGKMPTFNGLSNLQYAFLDFNQFDTIPFDFFRGLTSVQVLALDENPFNQTSGWALPTDLAECTQLVNFSCSQCNVIGQLPDFLGKLPSLTSLELSYNRLSGSLPSTFRDTMLQILWLNNQDENGLSGPIDVMGSMTGLTTVWLQGNKFTGPIPGSIGSLTSLKELNLNGNHLVGLVPPALAELSLELLDLNNNMLMGPIPKFKARKVTYSSNSFCQAKPGDPCSPEVSALLEFLGELGYPVQLASLWSGNYPCKQSWRGISCNSMGEVTVVNLQHLGLNGTLSPSLANLSSLREIHLEGNNLHGTVPEKLTRLAFLRVLNLNGNNFDKPLPQFRGNVTVVTTGNPKFESSGPSPPNNSDSPNNNSNNRNSNPPSGEVNRRQPNAPSSGIPSLNSPSPEKSRITTMAAAAAGSTVLLALVAVLFVYCLRRKKKLAKNAPARVASHKDSLKDPYNNNNNNNSMFKIGSTDVGRASSAGSRASYGPDSMEPGSPSISVHVLRKVTDNFAPENEIGRGGFGVVYKGELEDGTQLAVKRMVVGSMGSKALDEFRSEIEVLSNVRHRNLVSLLGFAVEGDERLLVYEYMPQGALSRRLFRWKSLGLEPLSWTSRLWIALDVARGVEYLHSLAHHSFIHRDLKSANILLDDELRAKVSDFGLVKLAPDREMSVATRLAGTFGYLAPEYAVTGKITTKVDVFSFGVVLMELLTGLVALDETRPEEKRYLAEWFWQIKSKKESLIASVDPALNADEDIHESIHLIATLAGHCTTRDPNHRPEMGHAVSVLAQLVERWRPHEDIDRESCVSMDLPLPQMLKGWQQEEQGLSRDYSYASQDSKGSIPNKPSGFADSFTSVDAR